MHIYFEKLKQHNTVCRRYASQFINSTTQENYNFVFQNNLFSEFMTQAPDLLGLRENVRTVSLDVCLHPSLGSFYTLEPFAVPRDHTRARKIKTIGTVAHIALYVYICIVCVVICVLDIFLYTHIHNFKQKIRTWYNHYSVNFSVNSILYYVKEVIFSRSPSVLKRYNWL